MRIDGLPCFIRNQEDGTLESKIVQDSHYCETPTKDVRIRWELSVLAVSMACTGALHTPKIGPELGKLIMSMKFTVRIFSRMTDAILQGCPN